MSKKRKQQAELEESSFPKGSADELSSSTLAAASRLEAESFPQPVREFLAEVGSYYELCIADGIGNYDLSDDDREWLMSVARGAVEAGFALALHRYSQHLGLVPELNRWRANRSAGAAKGRAAQEQTKATRAARAQSMLNDGIDVAAIARELGCSIQTVYRYLKPAAAKPTPAKPRKRSARSRPR
jgi:DNA-binding CsgD family transcriptional regulator